jgi:superfamily I DNA/RNA helicase/Zn-dependent peptidase ImmA (M78 family)
MDAWTDIRRKARACHSEALVRSNGDRRARPLVNAALGLNDLELRYYEPGSIVNAGVLGFLDRSSRLVNIAKHQDSGDEVVVIAHEIGHFKLHQDPSSEVTVLSAGLGGDVVDSGAGKIEGYSPHERKEIQADVFAGEFFCPADWLRDEYLQHHKRPSQIAAELGLPTNLVINQFVRALFLPPMREPRAQAANPHDGLDDSQLAAITWSTGPLLVDAGPGTGKTQTLVHRVAHLLGQKIQPASILALTFSHKAAEEMRVRLSALNPDAAIEMWVDTFHAFGWELITKWPSAVGRTNKVHILDQAGSLALLEDNLHKLPLRHYQNLYEPAFELVNVLRAISRCKDELIPPARYLTEAQAALDAANTDELRLNAEKAIEVAQIYQIYEDELRRTDSVDFGDLVLLAVKLVEEDPAVRAYVAGFKHVVVDEYQDVNLASSQLLKAIRNNGPDIWVVADQRQSIYRFRGAEPANVSRFVPDFGGTRHALTNNYRSLAPVVRTFEQFSATMGDNGSMTGKWAAHRGDGGQVTMTVSPSLAAEAESIRDKIEALRTAGVPYGEQVILARTHLTLARVTGILEQLGVPLLYLGDLFERNEIRTLLSLLSIDAEYGGIGLIRVAALPEYSVARDDALRVIRWSKAQKISVIQALQNLAEVEGLSEPGRTALGILAAELDGLEHATPWTMLTTWLFERSSYLRPLVSATDILSKQKLVAIYHLLKVCAEQLSQEDRSRRGLLNLIRRIESLNQDVVYRSIASEASDMDAVRVITIHGSKGLEFRAVHLPAIATRYMPTSRQAVRCPPPLSLAQLAVQPADHEAEEECLFFVALSRARDHLSLSRAERYTSQRASASKFLACLERIVPSARYDGSGKSFSEDVVLRPPEPRECYEERYLFLYMQCPARYRYEFIEQLRGSRDESPYIQFHRCVYVTVRWLEDERQAGNSIDPSGALAKLAAQWAENGPIGHGFEAFYRAAADEMVKGMAIAIAAETAAYDRHEWRIPVSNRQVSVTPDRIILTPDGTVHVQRIRTGRETKSEAEKPIYALLRAGAQAQYPGKRIMVETFYLSTGKKVEVAASSDAKSLEQYAKAIALIEQGNFEPSPDARTCPKCQCYFVCPS